MKKKIAFLTSDNYFIKLEQCPDFINEFALLQPVFQQLDAELILADWQDPSIDWQQFNTLIPKACWNYAQHPIEFESFIKKNLQFKISMCNHAETILWNMRKNYLLDLQKLGLPVADLALIPQRTVNCMDVITIALQTQNFDHGLLVAKPSIGGGAVDTIRCEYTELAQHETLFNKILSYADLIIQPYFAEIAEEGEYSYFFFDQKFSHAIVKKPAIGDYRAHQLYGAKNFAYLPQPIEIQQALQFVSALPIPTAYARVDVFRKNDILYLVELELIEPYLYFEHAPIKSRYDFCQAILQPHQCYAGLCS